MAGAALLGNSEIAGGMFLIAELRGPSAASSARNSRYKFLRPCVGAALYRMETKEDLPELLRGGQRVQRHGGYQDISGDQGAVGSAASASVAAPCCSTRRRFEWIRIG